MTLYFIFLFLVPFQEHPILGAQLFHVGIFPITPIKLVGIPLVAAALLLPRPRDAVARPGPEILLLFAGFALFQVLGTTLSSLSFPVLDASTLFSFAILMVATNLLICTQHRLEMTIRVIVLVETFASTWMYKQYYIYHWPRPLGPSADPNYEALSLVVTVALAIWMARYETRNLWKRVGWICTPILAFAVFISQSRGGLLALTVMAVLAWVNSQRKMQLLAGFVAATAFMFAIAPGQMLERIQQIQIAGQAETGAEVSTRARVELAKAGIGMMEAHPFFGVGLGEFKSVEFHYNPVLTDLEPEPKIAHDTYVQLGAEGGIPTLALYLAILLLTLATCRRVQKATGMPDDVAALALSFQIGLIGIMVAEFFLTAQYIKEVWVLISLAPNLYAISLHTAALSKKAASAHPEPVKPMVLRPRLRTG
ncbi:O-antigen ligase family protein [Candidatus Binatus sp.]|uniref:O-antigen ligase family protein n=1 Tax=Candidatus Binatus sp. TaxID=2811406 RepID=UPI003BD5CD8C